MASSIETGRRNPLSSWWWRIRHSAWLLAPVLGFGTFSFVGFLYCALRVRTRRWWIGAAITFILSTMIWVFAAIFFEPETDASQTPGGNFTAAYLLVVWAGQILYGFIVNRDYLSWLATRTAWYEQPVPNAPPLQAAPPAGPDATRQDILRNPQYWSNAEDRLAEVREAVEAVDLESLENTRQVNESRDLEFEVALDSLTRAVAEPGLSDVYTDRER